MISLLKKRRISVDAGKVCNWFRRILSSGNRRSSNFCNIIRNWMWWFFCLEILILMNCCCSLLFLLLICLRRLNVRSGIGMIRWFKRNFFLISLRINCWLIWLMSRFLLISLLMSMWYLKISFLVLILFWIILLCSLLIL